MSRPVDGDSNINIIIHPFAGKEAKPITVCAVHRKPKSTGITEQKCVVGGVKELLMHNVTFVYKVMIFFRENIIRERTRTQSGHLKNKCMERNQLR